MQLEALSTDLCSWRRSLRTCAAGGALYGPVQLQLEALSTDLYSWRRSLQTCAAGGTLYTPVQLEGLSTHLCSWRHSLQTCAAGGLSWEVEEVQEAVNNLVLADSLIPHQQQMLAQCIVLHHILQQTKMLHMCMQYVKCVRICKVKDITTYKDSTDMFL